MAVRKATQLELLLIKAEKDCIEAETNSEIVSIFKNLKEELLQLKPEGSYFVVISNPKDYSVRVISGENLKDLEFNLYKELSEEELDYFEKSSESLAFFRGFRTHITLKGRK